MANPPAHPTSVEVVVPDDRKTFLRNHVSWGAIFAGVVTALVVQLLLNILGLGVGASALDATGATDNPSASGFSINAGIWWTVSGIIASLIGGIVAGRLCGTSDSNTARWHGFVSWCAATLILFYLLSSAVGGIIGGTFNALGSTIGAAGRGAATAVTGAAQNGDVLAAQVRRLTNPNDAQSAQENITTFIRASISGDKAAADAARDRAVDSLAKSANISPDDARARLTQAEQQARQAAETAKEKAQQAAEVARKSVSTAGILGFVALAIGALAAWLGGGIGSARAEAAVVGMSSRRV